MKGLANRQNKTQQLKPHRFIDKSIQVKRNKRGNSLLDRRGSK